MTSRGDDVPASALFIPVKPDPVEMSLTMIQPTNGHKGRFSSLHLPLQCLRGPLAVFRLVLERLNDDRFARRRQLRL